MYKNTPLFTYVSQLLREIGVPTFHRGYEYLRRAILLSATDTTLLQGITTRLYPLLSEQYNTSPSNIERCIRYTIEATFIRGDLDAIHKYFGYTISVSKGKITNLEFISRVVDQLPPTCTRKRG